jgi:transcriptional regulator with XRE-family HTH domain
MRNPKFIDAAVNAAIRELRSHLKETQQRFALRIGIYHTTLAKWESLQIKQMPNAYGLRRLRDLANSGGRPDLAQVFHRALNDQLGDMVEHNGTDLCVAAARAIRWLSDPTPDIPKALANLKEIMTIARSLDPYGASGPAEAEPVTAAN